MEISQQEIEELIVGIAQSKPSRRTTSNLKPVRHVLPRTELDVRVVFYSRGKNGDEECHRFSSEDCYSAEMRAIGYMFSRPSILRAECVSKKLGIKFSLDRDFVVSEFLKQRKR